MAEAPDGKRDFFVSFNQADRAWATWIAWVLEEAGYSVFFQDWDFRGNFVEHMNRSHARAHRTLAVLSDNYFGSDFTLAEWSARFAQDPAGRDDRLVPVKVGPLTGETILGPIVHADLTECEETEAHRRLLARVKQAVDATYRPKPPTRPGFPGAPAREVPEKPRFPVAAHNLPPANPDFVGREEVLAAIHAALTEGASGAIPWAWAITGLGGVGKTQTALAYCYRHLADHTLVWWLRAETSAGLAADFTTLAEPLGLDSAAADQEKLIAQIRAALQASAGWLLVFDNVEDPRLPRAFLPATGQGHALITSRRTDWHGMMKARELEVMKEGEALQLLTGWPDPDTLPISELAEAKALAKELGYLPLALAQARAYMTETGKSLAGYRRLLQASRPIVLNKGRPGPDYPASVAKTWQLSIAAAEEECAAARPLLELLAFFSADPLPTAVLNAEPQALSEELRGELARDEAIGALKRFSLIQAEKDVLTVHRLVQAVTRDGLDATTARTHAGTAVRLVNAALPDSPEEHTNWPATGALLPHALAMTEAAERFEAGLEMVAEVLNEIAIYHHARAAYAEAESLYQRSFAIREKLLGPHHPNVAQSLNNLTRLYRETARYAEAEPLLKRSLTIYEKLLGPQHPNVAESLNNLAGLYLGTGRTAEAEPLLKRSLTIYEKLLGPQHPNVAGSLNNLALLYQDTSRYAEAEPLYQHALSIQEKVLGPQHPDVAQSLNNLAELYRATSRDAEAEPLYQRALAIREKTLGPEHPYVATSLNNLAGLYYATGRYAEAEPLFRRSIAILEKTLPPDHSNLMQVRENYAYLLNVLGRPAEAAKLRGQAEASR
jgi:tetratricopeptide (TPR) repeat protein